jgi:hypothetical protein
MVLASQSVRGGYRGGNWNNDASYARASDRNNAANTNSGRNNNNGARAAKTSLVLPLKIAGECDESEEYLSQDSVEGEPLSFRLHGF